MLMLCKSKCWEYCYTPLQTRLNIISKHLISSDFNRASGYIMNNPALAPQATMWGQPNSPQKRTTVERLQTQQPRPKVRCSLRANQAEKKSAKILTKQIKLNIFAVNRENRLRLGITLKLFAWRFCSRLALSLEKNKIVDSHDCPFKHIGT